jgi:hypothetical protein
VPERGSAVSGCAVCFIRAVAPGDEQLAESWLACSLGRALSHEEHLRISFVVLRRHGRLEGRRRIAEATRANCIALDAGNRFDSELTDRWTTGLAAALETSGARDANCTGCHGETG